MLAGTLRRRATPLLAVLAVGATSCAPRPSAAPGLPPRTALVELRLTPPRDLAAREAGGDTIRLRNVAWLAGRVAGGDADSLDFAPGELRRGDGVRDANLPRGLLVRLPRDPASGVALHMATRDTRPGVALLSLSIVALLATLVYVSYALSGS